MKRVISGFLVLVLVLASVRSSYATVATGAVTDRGVWTLTAQGAAKLGLAEANVAHAVRILGMLGRVSTAISVGIVAYEVTSGLWDWWTATYNQGAALTLTEPTGPANFGIQSGSGVFDCILGLRQVSPNGQSVYWTSLLASTCPGGGNFASAGYTLVGQSYSSSIDGSGWLNGYYYYHYVASSTLPVGSTAHIAPISDGGRVAFTAALDAARLDLTTLNAADLAMVSAQAGQVSPFTGSTLGGLTGILDAARSAVSSGVALTSGDMTVSNSGASTGTKPAEIASGTTPTEAPAIDLSGVTSAVSSMSATLSAAIAASQSAVVSAVGAVAAAVAAVQSAVAAIPAAIAASGAAVVSAVQAIAAPIVVAISASQSAVVSAIGEVKSAIQSISAGGGSAGTTSAVKDLAAQEAAREQAATDEAAASEAPSVECPECTREDKWAEAWETLRAAGMAAPVFGLINRIVINPTGTIERVRSVNTRYGALRFDLSAWGIDTYIGVVRYVVIFVALLAGYFVIFG